MVINFESWQAQLPRYVELILVVLLAWLVSAWWQTDIVAQQAPVSISQESLPAWDVHKMVATALFGENIKVLVPKKSVVKTIVASRLNVKLLATVVAGKRSAAVVILNGSGPQKLFRLGEQLQAGVVLEKVEVDAIVVNNHGSTERITMEKNKSIAGLAVFNASKKVLRKHLDRAYLNQAIGNFSKLLSQARALPHFSQGKADGFVLSEIVPGSLYQKIGLKNGDVLRKVNGQKINGAKQAMAMYQSLQSATAIDLELLRDGAIMPIHYEIR
ncbi:MAG: type II secretion system protein N [Mariprofundaceae bacterium]|nr:type II secretion system protein N [Mariprofundaceae bacterium]